MKKIAIGLGAIVILLAVAVVAVPRLIDWNSYKPEIAEAVREATGRELHIDGDIELSVLPNLTFAISDLRLANTAGSETPEMLTLAGVSGKMSLLPLLGRNVVVESLVIREPRLVLEVSPDGRPNWAFEAAAAKEAKEGVGEAPGGQPIKGLTLADVRLEGGSVVYDNALTGQRVVAGDIDLSVMLADLSSPLYLNGDLTLNQRPVMLELTANSPGALMAEAPAQMVAKISTELMTFEIQAKVQPGPMPALDGGLELEIPSVGELAAWLDRPLDPAQPDPGALRISAKLVADGAKVRLEEALVEGKAIKLTAEGSFDGSVEPAKLALEVQGGMLDVDAYLPPRPESAPKTAQPRGAGQAPQDLLAALPEEPFDLEPLSRADADIRVTIDGVKAMGYEVGRLAFTTHLEHGALAADLSELRLYGGNVVGSVKLAAAGQALEGEAVLTVDQVDVGALARAAAEDAAKVAGLASGQVKLSGLGDSPRALAESLRGNLALTLGGVAVEEVAVGTISGLEIALDLPGLEASPSLTGSVVYNQKKVALDLALDPLQKVLGGGPFEAKAKMTSDLVALSYQGSVQQQPVPGLDGNLDLTIPSVGQLAAWLGQPLDPAQPDPGALKVSAKLTADEAKVALEEAVIEGKALQLTAKGSFDGSADVAKLALDVKGGVLDLDAYLPPPAAAAPATAEAPKAADARGDLLAALPETPFDLAPLRRTDAEINLDLGGIRVLGYEVGRVAFATTLRDGALAADLNELRLYGGNVTGRVKLAAAAEALDAEAALDIDSLDIGKLARVAAGDAAKIAGIASGSLQAEGRGASPRALAESLTGKLDLKLGGVDVAEAAVGTISGLEMALDLPGMEAEPRLSGSVVYNQQKLALDVTLDPLQKVLGGEAFRAKVALASDLMTLDYAGSIRPQPQPGLDGDLELDVPSIGDLATWLGQPLGPAQPDPGALKLSAKLVADEAKVSIEDAVVEGKALQLTAKASVDTSQTIKRFDADVVITDADLDAYLPAPADGAQPSAAPATAAGPTGWSDEPIDFSALKQYEGDAKVEIGKVIYRGLEIEEGVATLNLAGGILTTKLTGLKAAEGTLAADATLDASGSVAALTYNATATGVKARPFLKSFAGNDRISGTADLEASGKAQGANQKELVENLNGEGQFKFLDGAIHGINLAASLRNAKTLGFGSSGDEMEKTDFAELSGSYTIKDGVVENSDFKMLAPLVRLKGEGLVPMPPRTVDYEVVATLVASLEGQGGTEGLTGLPIPITITGSWDKPSYGIDWKSVFKEAALDPERLKNMPDNLKDIGKDLGVDLAIPGVKEGGVGDVLKGLPGLSKDDAAKEGSTTSSTSGAVDTLKSLVAPSEAPAAEAPAEPKTEEKAPSAGDSLKKGLKGLFGN